MSPRSEPTLWLALACEDAGHFRAVTRLVDRVLQAQIDWFVPELRDWRAPDATVRWWSLKNARSEARSLGLPMYGHFEGMPGAPEAGMIRAQLLLWHRRHIDGETIDAAFLARDTDRGPSLEGAKQAVAERAWPFRILLAYPHPEIEAWHIVGFEPETDHERRRIDRITERLGFSPIREPHKLTSKTPTDRDAKKILDELVDGDDERAAACLDIPLDVLRARGQTCALTDFIEAVEREIVPPLSGSRS